MRAAPVHIRFAWATILALLLALRSLAPAGFMPAFDHGRVTIVACPDAAPVGSMQAHRHGDHKGLHQPCPYASASALGTCGADGPPLLAAAFFAAALLLGRRFLFVERQSRRARPPSRAPPTRA
ncbi:MAG TPA: DUF2946 family protein [Sphingomicrobium sp.]|nr:DUF2946 family protein [Sphingomicrobium sp.]